MYSYQFQTLQNYYTFKNAGHNYFTIEAGKADFMEILVKELTDLVQDVPNRRELDLEASSGGSVNEDGGINTSLIDQMIDFGASIMGDNATMSLVNVGTAVIAASISIVMQ